MLNGLAPKSRPLAGVESLFRRADIAYANLEIPLTTATKTTPRKSAADVKARRQYILKADPLHIKSLSNMGLDVVSLGNNHALDYREAGLKQMQGVLRKAGIRYCGAGSTLADASEVAVVEAPGGLKVGFLSALAFVSHKAFFACTPATAKTAGVRGLTYNGLLNATAADDLRSWFKQAKKRCDLLVVTPHWGEERKTVPKDYQIQLAHLMVDCGADVVLGAHPHVLQGSEIYRGSPICYSLGNLISPRPAASGVAVLEFRGKELQELRWVPVAITKAGKVIAQRGKASADQLKEIARLNTLVKARSAALARQKSKR